MKKLVALFLVCMLLCTTAAFVAAEEPMIIKVLDVTTQHTEEIENNVTTRFIEEKFNVKFEWEHISQSVAAEKFNIYVQGDSLPDLIMLPETYMDVAGAFSLGVEGVLRDMTDLIAEYGPNITKHMEEDAAYASAATAPDGAIYNIPVKTFGRGQEVVTHLFINAEWLKALNMEMPKTIDEFYAYLKGVKENDVNGNGDPNDEIPLMQRGSASSYMAAHSTIMGAFTPTQTKSDFMLDENNQVYFQPTADGYREGLAFLAKCYAEGLLYTEAYSVTRDGIWQIADTSPDYDMIGAIPGHNGSCMFSNATNRFVNYEIVPKLSSANFEGNYIYDPYYSLKVGGVIPASCSDEVAVKLMQIFDYFASEEGTLMQFRGPEGYYWEYAEEGELNAKGEQAVYRTFSDEEMIAKYGEDSEQWMDEAKVAFGWGWPAYQTEHYVNAVAQPVTEFTAHSQKFTSDYMVEVYGEELVGGERVFPSIFAFSEDALYDISLWKTDIDSYVNQSEAEFIMGKRDVNDDAEWQAYIDHLNGLGLNDYLEVVQAEWAAAQK